MGTEITQTNPLAVMPVMDIEVALQRRQAIVEFTKRVMKEDVDFGKVPGTSKDTLLKPGAEKLTTLFGLSPQFQIVEKCEDWTGKEHDGEPFFYFQYKCQLFRGDLLAGEGIGSCNSWEKKYRYRKANRVCPKCGQESIIKGKQEYGGGWLCWAKRGGCGAKFNDGDDSIESQETGSIKNENPQDQVNTIDKMAQKRALVAATLIAVNASEFFTQDLEDMTEEIIEAEFTEAGDPPKQPKQEEAKPARQKYQWEKAVVDKAKELQLVDKDERAVGILEASPFKSVPYGQLETKKGIAYIIAHNMVKEQDPKADSETRKKATRNLWDRDKDKLIIKANELLGG